MLDVIWLPENVRVKFMSIFYERRGWLIYTHIWLVSSCWHNHLWRLLEIGQVSIWLEKGGNCNAMHCNVRPYAAPNLRFNDEANSVLAYIGQCTAELLLILHFCAGFPVGEVVGPFFSQMRDPAKPNLGNKGCQKFEVKFRIFHWSINRGGTGKMS